MSKSKNKKHIVTAPQVKQIPVQKMMEFPNKQKLIMGLIVALIGFGLYFNTLEHGYVLDDYPTIKENKLTKKGLKGVNEIFHHSYWYGNDGHDDWLYRPLSVAMFAAEWEYWPDNSHEGHLVNILLYALSGFLTFLTLQKLLSKQNVIVPFIASLLFIAHPLHTEVVANIKSRDELLCYAFFLLSLSAILDYIREKKVLSLAISTVMFGLALFSKESAVTFLVVMPLAVFYFTDYDWKNLYKPFIPHLVMFGIFMLIYLKVLGGHVTLGDQFSIVDNTVTGKGFFERLPTCMYILGYYIRLLIFPHPLVYDYSYNSFDIVGWNNIIALISIAAYIGIAAFAIKKFFKEKEIVFGIVIYLLPIFLVSNIMLKTRSTAAERFLFIPSLGFCLIAAVLLCRLLKTETIKTDFKDVISVLKKNSTLFMIIAVLITAYSFKTVDRNNAWKDGVTLFKTDLKYQPKSARVQYSYANDLTQSLVKDSIHDPKLKDQYFNEALAGLNEAINIHKGYYEPYFALAQLAALKHDYVKSQEYYFMAKNLNSDQHNLHNNIGNNFFRLGKLDSAVKYLNISIQKDPENAEAYSNLGSVYFTMGKQTEAIGLYEKAISVDPNYFDAYKNMGSAYGTQGKFETALRYFFKASQLNSRDPDVYTFISITYKNMGDVKQADYYNQKANEARQRKGSSTSQKI